jgi:hypothetical protein
MVQWRAATVRALHRVWFICLTTIRGSSASPVPGRLPSNYAPPTWPHGEYDPGHANAVCCNSTDRRENVTSVALVTFSLFNTCSCLTACDTGSQPLLLLSPPPPLLIFPPENVLLGFKELLLFVWRNWLPTFVLNTVFMYCKTEKKVTEM